MKTNNEASESKSYRLLIDFLRSREETLSDDYMYDLFRLMKSVHLVYADHPEDVWKMILQKIDSGIIANHLDLKLFHDVLVAGQRNRQHIDAFLSQDNMSMAELLDPVFSSSELASTLTEVKNVVKQIQKGSLEIDETDRSQLNRLKAVIDSVV